MTLVRYSTLRIKYTFDHPIKGRSFGTRDHIKRDFGDGPKGDVSASHRSHNKRAENFSHGRGKRQQITEGTHVWSSPEVSTSPSSPSRSDWKKDESHLVGLLAVKTTYETWGGCQGLRY
ncbi:hypothetical protein Trydic_g8122 [Trypoxylus dichotomus]